MEHRNVCGVEARLIRWAVAVAARRHVEFRRSGGAVDDAGPLGRALRSERHEPVVAHHPDHVEIDHRDSACDRFRRMRNEIRGTAETCLFCCEEREHDRAPILRPRELASQALRDRDDRRGSRSVVVRAVVNCLDVGTQRAPSAKSEVIVVRAYDEDFAREFSAAGQQSRDVVRVCERRVHVDVPVDANPSRTRRGPEGRIVILLPLRQIDAEPFLRHRCLHLQHGNPQRALRSVVYQRRHFVFSFVLQRTGGEDHRGRAAFAGLHRLVTHRRPAAGTTAVEHRLLILLLRLVPQHERDLSFQIDAIELAIVERRRLDPVSDKDNLAGERPRTGEPERSPVAVRDAGQ